MRRLVSMIFITGISASVITDAGVPFNGQSGERLMESVASASRPAKPVGKSELTFTVADRFAGREIRVISGMLPDGYVWGNFVPAEWWANSTETFGAIIADDFYNLLPLDADASRHRSDLAPGYVTTPVFSNQYWSAGQGEIYGVLTDLYAPPAELRGEIARAFFYMSTVYHVNVWTPRAYMMFTSPVWPGLSDYAIQLLMSWHRASPPSASEIERNIRGEKLQGNRNPFTDYPELAEYLWGDRRGEKFVIAGEPQPLRALYRLDTDVIDLCSPWVPGDAEWQIDGRGVKSPSVPASQLGEGGHKLGYYSRSTGERGTVMIKIEK